MFLECEPRSSWFLRPDFQSVSKAPCGDYLWLWQWPSPFWQCACIGIGDYQLGFEEKHQITAHRPSLYQQNVIIKIACLSSNGFSITFPVSTESHDAGGTEYHAWWRWWLSAKALPMKEKADRPSLIRECVMGVKVLVTTIKKQKFFRSKKFCDGGTSLPQRLLLQLWSQMQAGSPVFI